MGEKGAGRTSEASGMRAPHLLGITERAESDAAARDEGERACYNIATPTERHLTISSANP